MEIWDSFLQSLKRILKVKRKPSSRRKKKPVAKRKVASAPKKAARGPLSKKSIKPSRRIPENKSSKRLVPKAALKEAGAVTHFFPKIRVVVVKVGPSPIKTGDTILIKGKATEFRQRVDSLQVESRDVKTAKRGEVVGLKVRKEAKEGDKIFIFSGK
ncbi:MAG: hypothetical protein HQL27_04355 [Candidatus Omnitrophica bacterium]|nr:hypothetical protein [Candidatus Omnitrophota bacterium]